MPLPGIAVTAMWVAWVAAEWVLRREVRLRFSSLFTLYFFLFLLLLLLLSAKTGENG